MTRTLEPSDGPPSLAELFTRYLSHRVVAQTVSLCQVEAAEVEPYESVSIQPVDPQLAKVDAIAVAEYFNVEPLNWPTLPEWSALVAAQEPSIAVPFCFGNFPQMVYDLQLLVANAGSSKVREPNKPLPAGDLTTRAGKQKDYSTKLLMSGILRLARHFDVAETLLNQMQNGSTAWGAAHANEVAALAWHRGRHKEALNLWSAQAESVPVLFNRGLAALHLGLPGDAVKPLEQAVAGLPETSAWYHLGQVYLTLATARA